MSKPPDPKELLELAVAVAHQAGLHAKEARLGGIDVVTKSSANDFVTQVDQQCEQVIVETLLAARPDDGVVGEEGASAPGTSGIVWHIDPIDGTTNYVYDMPGWCVSVGCEVRREGTHPTDAMVAGAVFDPAHDEMFAACIGEPTALNGEPIGPTKNTNLDSAVIATGFAYDNEVRVAEAQILAEILPHIGNIRRFGSAAIDLCWVAAGRVDAYYEPWLNLWDMAAGVLIARQSGVIVDNLYGSPPSRTMIFAAAPALEPQIRELLTAAVGLSTDGNPENILLADLRRAQE